MPRRARRDDQPLAGLPGQTHHTTFRGVNRMDLFVSACDFHVWMSAFADNCIAYDARALALALMTNHGHPLIEDLRGCLSQIMHGTQVVYAAYFNRTRQRSGPVFEDRFFSKVVADDAYLQAAGAYIHLNPVVTSVPMAESAEEYPWSTGSFLTAPPEVTAEQWYTELLERFGGIKEILASLPPTRDKQALINRQRRFERLASGAWLDRSRLLGGRSPEGYRQVLARLQAAGIGRVEEQDARHHEVPVEIVSAFESLAEQAPSEETSCAEQTPLSASVEDERQAPSASINPTSARTKCRDISGPIAHIAPPSHTTPACHQSSATPHLGVSVEAPERHILRDRLREAARRAVACEGCDVPAATRELVCYLAWRFTAGSLDEVAALLGEAAETVRSACERVRLRCLTVEGWRNLLWRAEWALRWPLKAGPWRI